MVSLIQAETVNKKFAEGWTSVPSHKPLHDRPMGGPTLLRKDTDYIFVSGGGEARPATKEEVEAW